ncbi:hypothetical protein HC251_20210 [Iamia sp. SCSIO 61187]|uniref:sunset domain-containing protein n=1 Tax=Iamia sp. SCSIO 61187 TaxID=2722752 RepID=UPI001C633716|nr:hypothetical protein [Iamia sp. SCSIO 61187]QYG94522.1 hypothetical protein HC251_20210 [Iamia sp. SCSIO 61187]
MRRPQLRSVFLLGILVGLVASLVRLLLRDARPAPAPLASPPAPLPSTVAAPPTPVPVAVADPPDAAPAPAASSMAEAPTPPTVVGAPAPAGAADPGAAGADPGEAAGADADADGSGADGHAWVAAVDGDCPDGYPIKAKVSSGIYHRPGGLSYERTSPDRCYPDVAAAEADGFRAAKR